MLPTTLALPDGDRNDCDEEASSLPSLSPSFERSLGENNDSIGAGNGFGLGFVRMPDDKVGVGIIKMVLGKEIQVRKSSLIDGQVDS